MCVDAGKHDDLQVCRIYRALADASAARSGYIRVIDDSGEDYLYPSRMFLPLRLSPSIREAVEHAASGVHS